MLGFSTINHKVLTIFLHRYASCSWHPRCDHVLTAIGCTFTTPLSWRSSVVALTWLTACFSTFWLEKVLHVMSSWWDFGLKTMRSKNHANTHDLWYIMIHDICTTFNLRSAWSLQNLYPQSMAGSLSRVCLEIISAWHQGLSGGFGASKHLETRCGNDLRTSESCLAGPCRCYLLQLSGMGRPLAQFSLTLLFPVEVQTCLEGCAVNSMKCS